jgi:serine protease Do
MGNSGGALVDIKGQLLGINTAIFSRTGGNQGIGFAVPANLAREVMQSLREKGRVVRGYIGASVQPLTPELAEAMKLKGQPTGALVGEVVPNSPSQKAGIKTGDVIAEMPAGVTAEGGPEASPEESSQPEKTTVFGGVAVADITDDIRTALNLSKDVKGTVIAEVDADSPAGKAGLREGDVIQEVNKQPVKNAKDLVAASKKLKPNEKILIRVYSQGRSGYVALEPK